MNEEEFNLKTHLAQEHRSSPFSDYLREIIYGGMDGIVTTFAVVAGFAGAGSQIGSMLGTTAVLLFGLANLFADGISMGLGNFLSHKSEKDLYRVNRAKEEKEIQENPLMEALETKKILMDKGYSEEDAGKMLVLYKKNPAFWVEFMMDYELEAPKMEKENELYTSLATFFSFVVFGFIPLVPYFFQITAYHFLFSIMSTAIALVLLGFLRWKVTGTRLFRSFFDTFIIGTIAALVAYMVGTFFKLSP